MSDSAIDMEIRDRCRRKPVEMFAATEGMDVADLRRLGVRRLTREGVVVVDDERTARISAPILCRGVEIHPEGRWALYQAGCVSVTVRWFTDTTADEVIRILENADDEGWSAIGYLKDMIDHKEAHR